MGKSAVGPLRRTHRRPLNDILTAHIMSFLLYCDGLAAGRIDGVREEGDCYVYAYCTCAVES